MNRTLKIFLIVGLSGLFLVVLAALVFFKFVMDHKEDWISKGRDTLQEGIEAGKSLRDDECLKEVVARHRDGSDGFAGLGARFWFKGCLQSATPTEDFCPDVPRADDIVGSIRWQTATCAKHGLSRDSTCGGTVGEIQVHCQVRALSP
jgi:hypothetical protein